MERKFRILYVYLAIAIVLLLILIEFIIGGKDGFPYDLLNNVIPDLIAAAIIFVSLYFLLERQGLSLNEEYGISLKNSLDKITVSVDAISQNRHPELIAIYYSFYSANWHDMIEQSNKQIDIVVIYFDSWIKQYKQQLIAFLRRPNSEIRFFVTNHHNKNAFATAHEILPALDADDLEKR